MESPMGRPEDVQKFGELLANASALVGSNYFLLPMANKQDSPPLIFARERVYAYELYHRLRCLWPDWSYSIGGEIDKTGHPILRGDKLDKAKPDLLVHRPGRMDQNLVAIEIKAASPKPPNNKRDRIKKDLDKLAAFCNTVKYERGLLLVFGKEIARIQKHLKKIAENGFPFDSLELWHQSEPGKQAHKIPWVASDT